MANQPPSQRYMAARGLLPKTPKERAKRAREVYFVQAVTLGLIKIGKAANARSRFAKMRTMSPDTLVMLGVVICQRDGELELELHAKFSQHRVHGEWFNPAPELLAYIRKHAVSPAPQTDWRVERKRPKPRLRLAASRVASWGQAGRCRSPGMSLESQWKEEDMRSVDENATQGTDSLASPAQRSAGGREP